MTSLVDRTQLGQLDLRNFVEFEIMKEGGKISEIKVKHVDLPGIVEHIYERIDPKNNLKDPFIHSQYNVLGQDQKLLLASQMLITRYCIHRILTHFKLYMGSTWTYGVGADYYGEEVNKVHIKPQVASKIHNLLEHLRVRNISEKLEMVLKMEYGHLIPSVVNKTWYVKQISRDHLYYSNTEHYDECLEDLQNADNEAYKKVLEEYPYPRGITILNPEGKYKVIDGYHRLVGTPEESNPLVIYCLRDD